MNILSVLWSIARLLTVVLVGGAVVTLAESRGLGSAIAILFLFVPVGWLGVVAAWSLWNDQDLKTDATAKGYALSPVVKRCVERDVVQHREALAQERRVLQARDVTLEKIHTTNRSYAKVGRPVIHLAPAPRPLAELQAEVRGPDENAILRGEAVAALPETAALPELAANGEGALSGLGFEIRVAHHRDESRRAR